MFAILGSASLLSSQRGRKISCPHCCVALKNPWLHYKCMNHSKKHKLQPALSGSSLFLCEYCFLFALSSVPSSYQTLCTVKLRGWSTRSKPTCINPFCFDHTSASTKSNNPIPAGSLKVIATSFTGWGWCISYLVLLENVSRQKGQLLSSTSDMQQQS